MDKGIVLCIDDDPAVHAFVQETLKYQGFAVRGVRSTEAALVFVEFVQPVLVITELDFPREGASYTETGLPLLDTLRQVCPAPRLVMSRIGERSVRFEATKHGANGYMTKPTPSLVLSDTVQQIIDAYGRPAPQASPAPAAPTPPGAAPIPTPSAADNAAPAAAPAGTPPAPAPPAAVFTGRKALVVEDERKMLQYLDDLLQAWGFDVSTASSVFAACQSHAGKQFDLVLCDLIMAGVSGPDVIRVLRERLLGENPKIIVITGQTARDVIQRCAQYGISDYMVKPVTADRLLKAVTKVLNTVSPS